MLLGNTVWKHSSQRSLVTSLGAHQLAPWGKSLILEIITVVVLIVLSLYDIKTRELPRGLVYSSLLLLFVGRILYGLGMPHRFLLIYVIFDSILLAMMALMARLGLIGWGDVAALAIITVSSPTPSYAAHIMPPLLLVLIYYVLVVGVIMVSTAIYNTIFHREALSKLPNRYKVIYLFIARPMKAQKILKKPGWWYPLNLCGEYKTSFNIYLDPPDIVKQVKQALNKGCIKEDSIIWVTYGLPGIPIITLAYILALTIGDKPFI